MQADPSHAFSHYNLAVLLEEVKGDYDGAEASFKAAIEANPRDAVVLEDYAMFLQVR